MVLISSVLVPAAFAITLGPTSFPVFLKEGFSTVLEFEEAPTRVVLGDPNHFQVEKLERAVVIKPLTAYATTNMFVYFKTNDARLFILTASEDAEPTYFKKFTTPIPPPKLAKKQSTPARYVRQARATKASLDKKKDYLAVDFEITADSSGKILVDWEQIRLRYKDRFISPSKLWSERREVQRDSLVKGRLVFTKPNVPADLAEVSIVVPVKGSAKSLSFPLRGVSR